MKISINLDMDDPQDLEIFRLISHRLDGPSLKPIQTYVGLWGRASSRTRETLLTWSKIKDEKYRTSYELEQELGLSLRRFHAAVANLVKWGRQTDILLLERAPSQTHACRLHKDFRQFILTADIDAPCLSRNARMTNQVYKRPTGMDLSQGRKN